MEKDMIVVVEEGEKKMKYTLADYIKMGIGIYIGYNLADILIHSMKTNIKQNKK